MPRKIVISVPVEPEQLTKLQLLSQRTKVPKSIYIREGIDRILDHYKDQLELFNVMPPQPQPTT